MLIQPFEKGYIFIDVLIAIFIFALSFIGVYTFTEEAVRNTQASVNLSQAVSIAQGKLELAGNAFKRQELFNGYVEPGKRIEGTENKMSWIIDSEWTEVPNLLEVGVEIQWTENKKRMIYKAESLIYVLPFQ